MVFGNTTTTGDFGEVGQGGISTDRTRRDEDRGIPIKDCWKTITTIAIPDPPVQITTNDPPGFDAFVLNFTVTLEKSCDCLPRGQKPPPKIGLPQFATSEVELECTDCGRYVPTGQDTGPYNIQLCGPPWGPKVIGTFRIWMLLKQGRTWNGTYTSEAAATIEAAVEQIKEDWLDGSQAGFENTCCGG